LEGGLVTVNEQLREAGERVIQTTREVKVPAAPSKARRWHLAPVLLALLAGSAIVATVWLASNDPNAPVATTIGSVESPLAEVWHHASDAIGRYQGAGDHDFLVLGDQVAVLDGEESDAVQVLDLGSGQMLSNMNFPQSPGNLLAAQHGMFLWGTYQQVGVNTADGTTIWDHDFGDDGRWPTSAVVDGDRLIVALDPVMEGDGRPPVLVEFDSSGNLLWSAELQGANPDEDLQWTDLLLTDGGVIVQTTGALYRLDSATGAQVWRLAFEESQIETFGLTGTMVRDGSVYAADPASESSGLDGGEVVGVSVEDGEIHLAFPAARSPRIVGVAGRWLVHSDESGIHGQSRDSRDVWTHTDLGALASIDEGGVVMASPESLALLDENGEVLREFAVDAGSPAMPPVRLGEVVLVPGLQGSKAIDFTTGQVIAEWPGSFYSPVLEVDPSTALVGVAGDGIYLVRLP
jgi:hypothetical protein